MKRNTGLKWVKLVKNNQNQLHFIFKKIESISFQELLENNRITSHRKSKKTLLL